MPILYLLLYLVAALVLALKMLEPIPRRLKVEIMEFKLVSWQSRYSRGGGAYIAIYCRRKAPWKPSRPPAGRLVGRLNGLIYGHFADGESVGTACVQC